MSDRQAELLDREKAGTGPVECLGMTFGSDEERREYFIEKLREKLQDPAFRNIEGFPIGSDEDILALSDPPYYTACPNPYLGKFVRRRNGLETGLAPGAVAAFSEDITGSKHGRIYNVHPYHTKVPPEAIVPLLEHYTRPSDVVLDPFSGTGMTGIAVELCNTAHPREAPRAAILSDISPIASFIAANYNSKAQSRAVLGKSWEEALTKAASHAGQHFRTRHIGWRASETYPAGAKNRPATDATPLGEITYVVWSDVYRCSQCGHEVNYWKEAVDLFGCHVSDVFSCPRCAARLCKEKRFEKTNNATVVERVTEKWFDPLIGGTTDRQKRSPSLISYKFDGSRYEKWPDVEDFAVIEQSDRLSPDIETVPMMFMGNSWGDTWRAGVHIGITHWHHFFTNRNLLILSDLLEATKSDRQAWFAVTAGLLRLSRLNRYMPQHRNNRSREVVGPLSGTLYVPAIGLEVNPIPYFRKKLKSMDAVWGRKPVGEIYVTTQSSNDLKSIPSDSIDYVFADPPFGDNLFYSELNFIWESVLRCHTAGDKEAVVSVAGKKALSEYTHLMVQILKECNRVLKAGHWITIEFHNSKNTVWAAIHEAIESAGFIIADVRTLDKKKGTTKQLTFANTVKQDLIISAYKPNGGLEQLFALTAGTEQGVWDFLRTHLAQLPVFVAKDGEAQVIAERQDYLLFDRMVAFHVQRGVSVPLAAAEFYADLFERYALRDNMYFLPEQVAEYDERRMSFEEVSQLQLFVTDEASAIQWLKQQLTKKPQTFQELHSLFLKEIGGWQKHEAPLELSELLAQNFLRYDGANVVQSQIHSYLSTNFRELRNLAKDDRALRAKAKDRWYVPDPKKSGDLEKLRERALLREFEGYRESREKRLKVFRLEAVRAGFRRAWQERDYATIISIAKRVPENVLQEDPKLLMWYDQALTRTSGGG